MAKDADVKKLVLTHFTPGEVDEVATKEAISKQFKGEIIFGHDLKEVGP
jgi:ribonuclease BN (tRNA processing enzyme)